MEYKHLVPIGLVSGMISGAASGWRSYRWGKLTGNECDDAARYFLRGKGWGLPVPLSYMAGNAILPGLPRGIVVTGVICTVNYFIKKDIDKMEREWERKSQINDK